MTHRARIEQELERIALDETELSGRAMQTRVQALRLLERVTRPDQSGEPPAEPQVNWDYPCDEHGVFEPTASPQWWPLRMNWRWTAGDPIEAAAIERWRNSERRTRWETAGSPWAHSEWMLDPEPWRDGLARLEE